MSSTILVGDALERLQELPDESVQCVVTSPPYWGLRDYGVDWAYGLEPTLNRYISIMVEVFSEVRRVLRKDGTLWLNLGDVFWGGKGKHLVLKPKDLIGLPWRIAFALQADGWYLRSDIIWHKPNPMPESVTDRPTRAHEYVFLLTKSARYFYDADAIRGAPKDSARASWHGDFKPRSKERREDEQQAEGANKRSVWTIATKGFPGAHFATFPPALVEPCILAGSRGGDTILDPFCGSGTTGLVALRLGRKFIGIELNPEYAAMAERRIREDAPLFNEVEVIA